MLLEKILLSACRLPLLKIKEPEWVGMLKREKPSKTCQTLLSGMLCEEKSEKHAAR